MKKHFLIVTCALWCGLAVALPVLAQPRSLTESFDQVKTQAEDLGLNTESEPDSILKQIIRGLLALVGTLALVLVIYGGFVYLTSAGDDNRAAKGKQIILGAIIGLILIGLSAVIVNLTIGLFGGDSSGTDSSDSSFEE